MPNDRGLKSIKALESEHGALLKCAMTGSHAHLVFDDRGGSVRDFAVKNPYLPQGDDESSTAGCGERVAVTNDVGILTYLAATQQAIPYFPAAGDRPIQRLNPGKLNVGLVNAGGPAPGLNVVNDSITKRLFELATRQDAGEPHLVGYRRGFQGLLHQQPDSKLRLVPSKSLVPPTSDGKPHDPEYLVTDDFSNRPATFLKSSRFKLKDHIDEVADAVRSEQLDVLFVCGGDGSFRGATAIKKALAGYQPPTAKELTVVCGPKTMDWDLQFTDTTFGFTTTVDYLVDAIRTFHETIECQDRVGLMQVFGAASGFVALYAAYCSGEVDFVILPEEVEREGLNEMLGQDAAAKIDEARFDGLETALQGTDFAPADIYKKGFEVCRKKCLERVSKRLKKKGHALVVVAEGAPARFSHGDKAQIWSNVVADFKKELTAMNLGDFQVTDIEPRYLIRDNAPRSYDTALCKFIGKAMVDAAIAGYTDCMVARWCGRYVLVPIELATKQTSQVDPDDYFYRTMVGRYQLT